MDFEQRLIEVYENLGGTDKLDELVLGLSLRVKSIVCCS